MRRTIGEYRALQKKYDCVKPIWSTELGLNSQGQTRHVVAVELVKKFATFFAAGGENVSWFGLLYPDPDGKSYGSCGDSHNVFDCRYNRYAPRLDAVMYYHMVNAVGIKKFVEEKTTATTSTRSSSATATASACRCCGRTRVAKTSKCHWPASARSR